MRPTCDQWALGLALLTAQRGTCLRRQVGCVLLSKRGHVLATGYNGVAAGQPHCREVTREVLVDTGFDASTMTRHTSLHACHDHACQGATAAAGTRLDACQAIHAEQNALLQCHDVYAIHTCYTTASPCITCAKLLLNTGCQRIVFIEAYPHPEAQKLWERAGRVWEQLTAGAFS